MSLADNAIESRLAELGFVLPEASAPLANYVPAVVSGRLLIVSGQLPMGALGLSEAHKGKLGDNVSEADGRAAAQLCALNILAQARAKLGDLRRIEKCLRLGGFINCTADFTNLAAVMNGASDLIAGALGENGRHARSTVGVAQLPLGAAVEVEAMFEFTP